MALPQGRKSSVDSAFLTTSEVLRYLNVNVRTIYRLARNGAIPAVRIGRQWRFRRSDLDAWLDSQRAMPTVGQGSDGFDQWNPRVIG